MRNVAIRNNGSPLPSVSGVSRHEAQYSRVEVSRVTVFQLQWIPGSGAEVQKTLAIRKSSKDVNPLPGRCSRHRRHIADYRWRCHRPALCSSQPLVQDIKVRMEKLVSDEN